MSLVIEDPVRTLMCDAAVDSLDVGAGTAQMKLTSVADVVLSEHNLANPACGGAVNGVATLNAVSDDLDANATGDATKCKWYDRNAALRWTGTVTATAGGGDVELNSITITQHVKVSITAGGTITQPAS